MKDGFLVSRDEKDAWARLSGIVDRLVSDREAIIGKLRAGNTEHVNRAKRNRELLRDLAKKRGWRVYP